MFHLHWVQAWLLQNSKMYGVCVSLEGELESLLYLLLIDGFLFLHFWPLVFLKIIDY